MLEGDKFYIFGNGDLADEMEKLILMKDLTEHAFSVFEHRS